MARCLWLGLCLVVACQPAPPAEATEQKSCPVDAVCLSEDEVRRAGLEFQAAEAGRAESEVRATGRLAFDDLRVAYVVSPLSGRLASVAVALGEQVARNAPLASLHAPQMGSMLADAAAALADEVAAERDLLRQKALFAEHAIAKKDFQAAVNRAAQAKATAAQAREKQQLFGAKESQGTDTYVLRAPIEGRVVARNVTVGTEVTGSADAGSAAAVLFTIGSLETIWVLGEVFAIDAASIRPGADATVRLTAYPDLALKTKVDWIATTVDPVAGTVRVRCRLDNPSGLFKPEMTAGLTIETATVEGIWVGERSVFHLSGRPHVFVVERRPDRGIICRRRPVQIVKASADRRYLLADGLAAGETIVSAHGILLTGDEP